MQWLILSKTGGEAMNEMIKKMNVWLQELHEQQVPISLMNVYLGEHNVSRLKIHIWEKFHWPNQSEVTDLLYMEQSGKCLNYAKNLSGPKNLTKVLTNPTGWVTVVILTLASPLDF